MGFFKFIFAFMFVIPIAVLMCFLLYKLNADSREAAKKATEIESRKRPQKTYENTYGNRRYAPGYSNHSERQFSYSNPYESKAFGSAAAEIKRREQENHISGKQVKEKPKAQKPLSKRKRRKERKNRKKDRDK